MLFLSYPMAESLNQEPMPNFWHKKDYMLNYGQNKWAIVVLLQIDIAEYFCDPSLIARFIWNAEISVSVAIHCYERLF